MSDSALAGSAGPSHSRQSRTMGVVGVIPACLTLPPNPQHWNSDWFGPASPSDPLGTARWLAHANFDQASLNLE